MLDYWLVRRLAYADTTGSKNQKDYTGVEGCMYECKYEYEYMTHKLYEYEYFKNLLEYTSTEYFSPRSGHSKHLQSLVMESIPLIILNVSMLSVLCLMYFRVARSNSFTLQLYGDLLFLVLIRILGCRKENNRKKVTDKK